MSGALAAATLAGLPGRGTAARFPTRTVRFIVGPPLWQAAVPEFYVI